MRNYSLVHLHRISGKETVSSTAISIELKIASLGVKDRNFRANVIDERGA